jgi:hypothetical protein
VGRCVLLD